MTSRLAYALVTIGLGVIASIFANWIRRGIIARQNARLEHWDSWTMAQRVECLREMKDQTIRDAARRVATGIVAGVLFVWFMPSSLFWISNVADEAKDLSRRVDENAIATDISSCRIRNAGEEANRQGAFRDIAAISRFLLRMGVPQDSVDDLAEERRAAIPPVAATDRDCDRSGVNGDEGDYPPTTEP